MRKRFLAAVTAAVLLFLFGCSLLPTEYLSVKDYTEDVQTDSYELTGAIDNYSELKRALMGMVQRHEENGKLTFSNYDGTVSDDIAIACWEVKSETALGAYAVDYMSYEINRIVSYFEAEVFITYRRTQEQVDSIATLSTSYSLDEVLENTIRAFEPQLTVKLNSASLTAETIEQKVSAFFMASPIAVVTEPKLSVSVYPESGIERIFEISINYGHSAEELQQMKQELINAVVLRAAETSQHTMDDAAAQLARALAEDCELLPQGGSDELDSTAYGAVVNKRADSRGMALAYMALCIADGIDCVVVEGRLNKETHYWNIVTINGVSRHIDASAGDIDLRSDAEVLDRYWWDTDAYPVCQSNPDTQQEITETQ